MFHIINLNKVSEYSEELNNSIGLYYYPHFIDRIIGTKILSNLQGNIDSVNNKDKLGIIFRICIRRKSSAEISATSVFYIETKVKLSLLSLLIFIQY